MPALSIIIPVYNVGKYLEECIDSILSQTFTDWELIMVDDGSTDGSQAICDRYSDKDTRITVIHIPNSGQSKARNVGIKKASGKFISFVDSDDCLVGEDTLNLWVGKMIENTDVDMYVFPHQRFGENLNQPKQVLDEKQFGSPSEFIENLDIATLKKKNTIVGVPWGKVYRAELFETVNFPEGMFYEDTYMLCDIFEVCRKIGVSNCGCYGYRIRQNSTSNFSDGGTERKRLDRITMQIRVLQALIKHSENLQMRGEFIFDLINAFLKTRSEFGESSRYKLLLDQFESHLSQGIPNWDLKSFIKSMTIRAIGLNNWIKLRSKKYV